MNMKYVMRLIKENRSAEALVFFKRAEDGSPLYPEVVNNIARERNALLIAACRGGHIAIVRELLAKKADGSPVYPDVVNNIAIDGNYPLYAACSGGHIAIVRELLAQKADGSPVYPAVVDSIAKNDNEPLNDASLFGHIEIVRELLAKKADGSPVYPAVVDSIVAGDASVLWGAYIRGHTAIVRMLLEVNAADGKPVYPEVVNSIAIAAGNVNNEGLIKDTIGESLDNYNLKKAIQFFRLPADVHFPDEAMHRFANNWVTFYDHEHSLPGDVLEVLLAIYYRCNLTNDDMPQGVKQFLQKICESHRGNVTAMLNSAGIPDKCTTALVLAYAGHHRHPKLAMLPAATPEEKCDGDNKNKKKKICAYR